MSQTDPRVTTLFGRALDVTATERDAFLARECGDDAALANEIKELLRHHDSAGTDPFWQASALEHERAAPDPSIGQSVGPYRIEALIGVGGMGRVYRAVRDDAEFQKHVAIKLIKRGMDADAIVARFRAERQILAGLEHPNIARLLDGGTDTSGLPYLVMEYVEGQPLTTYLKAQPRVDVGARIRLFRDICSAVHYAHQRMVVHRDLKPANLLVDANGTPKLLDFGIAKLLDPLAPDQLATIAGERVLTPAYASPEQTRGELATAASDVYSLGAILHEMLTGAIPKPHEQLRLRWIVTPDRPRDLENIVAMALHEDPARRYASVAQFSDDLARYLDGRPVTARGYSTAYVATRFMQRNKALTAAAALVVVTLVGGIITTRMAQARAERRFREVQKLAHAMVFDYSDAIRGLPGATEVEKKLVTDALTYLDGLSRDAAGDIPLRRDLLGAYSKISQVQGDPYHSNIGETAAALETGRKGLALGERLLAEDATPNTIEAMAYAYKTMANVLSSTGDLAAVDDFSRRALALYERLSASDPGNEDYLLSLSQAQWGLGDLNGSPGISNLGKSKVALDFYQRALATARAAQALQTPPDNEAQMRAFWSLDSLALMELALGRVDDAIGHGRASLDLVRALSNSNRDSVRFRSGLSLALDHNGRFTLAAGSVDEALRYFREAETMARLAVKADTEDVGNRRKLGIVLGYLSLGLRIRGDHPLAVAAAEESLSLMEVLSAKDPANTDRINDVAIAHRRVADAFLGAGRYPQALTHATESTTRHLRSPIKGDAFLTLSTARALLVRGSAESALKRFPEATRSLQQAHDLLAPLHQRDVDSAMIQTELARAASRLGAALKAGGQSGAGDTMLTEARRLWADLKQKGTLLPQDRADAEGF